MTPCLIALVLVRVGTCCAHVTWAHHLSATSSILERAPAVYSNLPLNDTNIVHAKTQSLPFRFEIKNIKFFGSVVSRPRSKFVYGMLTRRQEYYTHTLASRTIESLPTTSPLFTIFSTARVHPRLHLFLLSNQPPNTTPARHIQNPTQSTEYIDGAHSTEADAYKHVHFLCNMPANYAQALYTR